MSTFVYFLIATAKVYFLEKRLDHRLKFDVSLFAKILKSLKLFGNS